MRTPRLLYVATVPAPLRNFYLPYALHFRSLGWEVHAAARGATGEPSLQSAFDSVSELEMSRSLRDPFPIARGIGSIRGLARAIQPDLIHVHTPIAGFVTRFALGRRPLRARPALVYTAHGFHAFNGGRAVPNAIYSAMETVGGRWGDALIVINDDDQERARRWHMADGGRLVRMPGVGVDTAFYDATAVSGASIQAFRASAGIDPEARLVVMIAELHRPKRPLDAIRSFAQMHGNDAHLAVLGQGPMEQAMRSLAIDHGVSDRIHFCGFMDDVRPALASATVTLLTSEREGLPRAIMESLSMGVPVVSTAARGCAELVDDAGCIVPIGDVVALAKSLDRMHRDTADWAAMSASARLRMKARYGLERVIRMHEELYRDVLRVRARASGGPSPAD